MKRQFRDPKVFDALENYFYDQNLSTELKNKGYVKFPLLSEDQIATLLGNLRLFTEHLENKPEKLFYASGRDKEHVRNIGKALSWPVVEPSIGKFFNVDALEIEGCSWLLKPIGEESYLSPHQDSSLVDETRYTSFYGWLPLINVSKQNGTVFVLPGSHLWSNYYRSLDVPWAFEEYREILEKYCIPIEMTAGEILLFEGSLIHGSSPNFSSEIRPALNIFFKDKNVPYMHYMTDHLTPVNNVECYKVNMDFFFNHDYRKRPDTDKFPFVGYRTLPKLKLNRKKVEKMCKKAILGKL